MKSLTLDDVFTDYSNYHSYLNVSCDKQGDNKISKHSIIYTYITNECLLRRKITRNIVDNLKVKHYIKIGEDCPICYESIFNRRNAFLTDCGHSFHYKCIIDYDYKNIFNNVSIMCPICRSDMGNYDDMKDRYKNSNNVFDILEDVEMNLSFKFPKTCYNLNDRSSNNHFHRMCYNNCATCRI